MKKVTARIAEPISGDSLYQIRARKALPLLVRQAEAAQPIVYMDLAEELDMPNPRNLNYPLGSIGKTIENLSKVWKEKIPPIQCLVINKHTGIPGGGIGWFLRGWTEEYSKLPRYRQREIVAGAHALIFAYPRWKEVLRVLSLEPVQSGFVEEIDEACFVTGGGGESDRHRELKEFVARNPASIGLHKATPVGSNEVLLPSGDCLDVSFNFKKAWVAAEVKTMISSDADIIRGLFQCIKYRAVMMAVQAVKGEIRDARAVLALEGKLPSELVALRNVLGIEVYEAVRSPQKS